MSVKYNELQQSSRPAAPAAPVLKGTVGFVRKGTKAKYAYVNGDDGKEYAVNEDIYAKTPNAETVIVKDDRISFTVKFVGRKTYIENIKPAE